MKKVPKDPNKGIAKRLSDRVKKDRLKVRGTFSLDEDNLNRFTVWCKKNNCSVSAGIDHLLTIFLEDESA